jgi:putative NADH-flavin reductase
MNQYNKIAVIGGGGRTGNYLVQQLISAGYSLKLLLRSPENFQIESPLVEIIKGDALDTDAINQLLSGCCCVISTIGQRPGQALVAERVTDNILNAMSHYGFKRYILVAGINIDTPSDRKGPETVLATNWMKTNYPDIQTDRQNAYSRLLQSHADWTLVRVPLIQFSDQMDAIHVDLYDCPGIKVSAGNIAAFLIQQINDRTYLNKAPFVAGI